MIAKQRSKTVSCEFQYQCWIPYQNARVILQVLFSNAVFCIYFILEYTVLLYNFTRCWTSSNKSSGRITVVIYIIFFPDREESYHRFASATPLYTLFVACQLLISCIPHKLSFSVATPAWLLPVKWYHCLFWLRMLCSDKGKGSIYYHVYPADRILYNKNAWVGVGVRVGS